MIQKHCFECGTALIEKELEEEGIVPYCPKCQQYRFPMYNVAVSMIVVDEETGKILLIQQYSKLSYILVAGYVNRGEAEEHAVVREVREETGLDLPPIAIAAGGKPYFPGSDWHFSISHTPRHAFCALSRREIGIDAEELDRNVNLALAEKILSPKEKAQFDAAPDKRRALLTFWVLKEAQVKRTGDGLRGYPNGTDFSLNDPRVTEMDGCLVAVIE